MKCCISQNNMYLCKLFRGIYPSFCETKGLAIDEAKTSTPRVIS